MALIKRMSNCLIPRWMLCMAICFALRLFFAGLSGTLYGQENANNKEAVWSDDQWDRIQKGVEFGPKKQEEKEQSDTDENQMPLDSSDSLTPPIMSQSVAYVLLVVLVAAILLVLFRQQTIRRDRKVTSTVAILAASDDEDHLDADFDRMLIRASAERNYRFAIRWLFMDTLKWMDESQLIVWKKHKTNRQYAAEIKREGRAKLFRQLMWVYELIWFGERELEETEYLRLKGLFDTFKSMKDE